MPVEHPAQRDVRFKGLWTPLGATLGKISLLKDVQGLPLGRGISEWKRLTFLCTSWLFECLTTCTIIVLKRVLQSKNKTQP